MQELEKELLEKLVDNALNVGKAESYVEIDSLEEICDIPPNTLFKVLNFLGKKGLIVFNDQYVRVSQLGLQELDFKGT